MKISKILFVAAVLIFAAALFSCAEDEGLGLPGTKKPGNLQNYVATSTFVKEDEALAALNAVLRSYGSFISMLEDANDDAYRAAFLTKYLMSPNSYYLSKLSETSISVGVDIKDSVILKTEANKSSGSDVITATIEGSSKSSIKSNKPLSQAYYGSSSYFGLKGDNISYSDSINKTFAITSGWYQFGSGTTYKVSGYITVVASENDKTTVKDFITVNDVIIEDTGNVTYKTSVALSIVATSGSGETATSKGGKFIFSVSGKGGGTSRYYKNSGEVVCSDIVVYDNAGTVAVTIRDDKALDWLKLGSNFFD